STRRQQLMTERLDARRVAQVQAENFQPIAPVPEIRLRRIARGRVAWETRGDDQTRTRTQQLQTRLVADLDPPAGQQRDAPAQIRRFGTLGEIECRTLRAQLVVESVDQRIFLLADVAML